MYQGFAAGTGAVTVCLFAGGLMKWNALNSDIFLIVSLIAATLSAIAIGSITSFILHVKLSPPHKVKARIPNELYALQKLASSINCDTNKKPAKLQGIIISRKIDAAINSILNSFVDNDIAPWYSKLVHNPSPGIETLKNTLWYAIISLHERISKVDHARFVMCGLVSCFTQHLEKVRLAEAAGEAKGERGIFHLTPQLSSPVRERNFLRLVAEFLVIKSLPPEYHRCTALRTMLKELIAYRLLEPLIDRICDPDWINQHLTQYLRQQQAAEELGKRTYHYAASYEDFITIIHDSNDIVDLKHLRRNIINEIMQATAINNLKKAKGMDIQREANPLSAGKGDLLQARNLKRYINQLTYAKAQCERRINLLKNKSTGTSSSKNEEAGFSKEETDAVFNSLEDLPLEFDMEKESLLSPSEQNLPTRKILLFQAIMECAFARQYFAIYLDEIGQGSLLSFWSAVQELRHADKRQHYQLGVEIYHTYLATQSAPIKVDKVCIRGVEAFLLGNRGPEVLFEIAEELERNLEDRYYAGFLVSSTYHTMLRQANMQGIDFMTPIEAEGTTEKTNDENAADLQLQLSHHSTYAKNKLAHIQEKLTNKLLALQAIQQTNKADPKVIQHLENQISTLRSDRKLLEAHVERTAYWSEGIGHWRVFVQAVQLSPDKEMPHLVLLVHKDTDALSDELSLPSSSSDDCSDASSNIPSIGWVIIRKLNQLIDLHRKLCQISPSIKSLELPSSQAKLLFNKLLDKDHLDKLHTASQNFFNTIMTDEKLSGSELIYAFLSPSPEHLKEPDCQPKKSRFSLSTLFKGSDGKSDYEDEEIGNLIMMESSSDHISEGGDAAKDSVAEPLFDFLEELCELRGVGKWLRKTLISFVQITYGKNITKHVREIVQGLVTESMVVYYLQTLQSSFWQDGEMPSQNDQQRSPEDILRARNEAQEQFVKNQPELLCTLVGQQNARKGATRLFCTLQHHALNKNLFYAVLEVLLKQLFPELQERMKKKS